MKYVIIFIPRSCQNCISYFIRNSKILLLDEATAAIDTHTDQKIQVGTDDLIVIAKILDLAHIE